ncbi:hypothetical protein V6N13_135404 [Hibiscus sabdariffa]
MFFGHSLASEVYGYCFTPSVVDARFQPIGTMFNGVFKAQGRFLSSQRARFMAERLVQFDSLMTRSSLEKACLLMELSQWFQAGLMLSFKL